MDSLVGAWHLGSTESRTETGEVIRRSPQGSVIGYIIYTDDGHVAYLRMKSTLPDFVSGNMEGGTPEEKAAAWDNSLAYCGTYSLKDNRVVHHVEASSFPNIVGTDQVRTFTLAGDELTVTTPLGAEQTGTPLTNTLVFQRASRG